MVSTPLWCIASNRIGRKPTVLIGLLATAVSIVLFGMSKSLLWAIATRCFCGLMNGNAPVARTMVGEMAEATRGDKGKAFSLFGFCLASGWTSKCHLTSHRKAWLILNSWASDWRRACATSGIYRRIREIPVSFTLSRDWRDQPTCIHRQLYPSRGDEATGCSSYPRARRSRRDRPFASRK